MFLPFVFLQHRLHESKLSILEPNSIWNAPVVLEAMNETEALVIDNCTFQGITALRHSHSSAALRIGSLKSLTINDSKFERITGAGLFTIVCESVLDLVIQGTTFLLLLGGGVLKSLTTEAKDHLSLLNVLFESITFSSGVIIESAFKTNVLEDLTFRDLDVGMFATFRLPADHVVIVRKIESEFSRTVNGWIGLADSIGRSVVIESSAFRRSYVSFPEESELFFDDCVFSGGPFAETGISAKGTVVMTNCTIGRFETGLATRAGTLFVCQSEFTDCDRGIDAGGTVNIADCKLSGYADWGIRIGGDSVIADCAFFNERHMSDQLPLAIAAGSFGLSLDRVCVDSDGTVVNGGTITQLVSCCFRSRQSVAVPTAVAYAESDSFECDGKCPMENPGDAAACESFPTPPPHEIQQKGSETE